MPRKQRSSIKLKRRPFSEGDGVSISSFTQSTEAGAVKDETSTNVEVGAVKDETLNKVVVGAVKDEASANVEIEAVKDEATTSVKVKEVKYDTTQKNVGVTINTDNEKMSHEYTKQNSTRIHLSHGVRTKFTINVGPIDNDLKYTVTQNVTQLSPQLASNYGESKQNFSDSAKTFTNKEPVLEEVFIEDIRQNEESLPVNVEEMLFLSEDEPQTNKIVETQYKKVSSKDQNVGLKIKMALPSNENLSVVNKSGVKKNLHVFKEDISPLIKDNDLESISFDTFEILADKTKGPNINLHKTETPQINFSISRLGLNVSGKKKKDTGEDSDSDDDSEKGKKKKDKDKSGFGFGMKMPKFGGSGKADIHGPEVDVDGKLKGGISADVDVPHLKSKVEGPEVDISAKLPSGNVDINASFSKGNCPGYDAKGFNISSNTSNFSNDSSTSVVDTNKVAKKRKDNDKSSLGFKLKIPKFGGSSKADSCGSDLVAGGNLNSDISVDPLDLKSTSDVSKTHISGGKMNVTLSGVSECSDKVSKNNKKRHLFGNNKKSKNNSNFFCSLEKPSVESPELDSHGELSQPSGEIAPSDSFVAIDIGENSLIDNQDLSVNASPRSASFLQKFFQKSEPKPKSQSLSDDRTHENKNLSTVDKKAFKQEVSIGTLKQEVSIGDVKQDFVIIESSSSPKNDHIKSPKSPSLLRRIGMFFHLHSDNYNLEKVDSESHSKEDKASDLKDSHSVKGDDCFEIPDVVITVSKNTPSTLSVTHSSANSSGLPTVVEGNVSPAISGENIVSDGDSTQKTKSTLTSDFSISGESSVKFSMN